VQAASASRDSAIGEDKNGSDVIEVFLNFSGNTLPVDPGSLKTSSIDQPRSVEDVDLVMRLCLLTTSENAQTYDYAVFASKFVKARLTGVTLIG